MGVRRPEWVLAAAVVVCLPMVPDILSGAIGTTAALVRFLGAILVCWVLASIVQAVLDRYADAAARREYEVQMAGSAPRTRCRPRAEPNDAGGPSGRGELDIYSLLDARSPRRRRVLVLSRRSHESIRIGDTIVVTVLEVRGDHVRLGIDAPHDIEVHRQEVYDAIQSANMSAASPAPGAVAAAASTLRQLMGSGAPEAATAATPTPGRIPTAKVERSWAGRPDGRSVRAIDRTERRPEE